MQEVAFNYTLFGTPEQFGTQRALDLSRFDAAPLLAFTATIAATRWDVIKAIRAREAKVERFASRLP